MAQLTFTTREARRSGLEPRYTVWFETDQGRVAIEMSDSGLLMLHGLVSQVVTTMKTDWDERPVPGIKADQSDASPAPRGHLV